MKPFVSSIGLWVGYGTLHFGSGDTEGMRGVLGHAYIPVTSVLAFAVVVGTMQLLRWLIRKHVPHERRAKWGF